MDRNNKQNSFSNAKITRCEGKTPDKTTGFMKRFFPVIAAAGCIIMAGSVLFLKAGSDKQEINENTQAMMAMSVAESTVADNTITSTDSESVGEASDSSRTVSSTGSKADVSQDPIGDSLHEAGINDASYVLKYRGKDGRETILQHQFKKTFLTGGLERMFTVSCVYSHLSDMDIYGASTDLRNILLGYLDREHDEDNVDDDSYELYARLGGFHPEEEETKKRNNAAKESDKENAYKKGVLLVSEYVNASSLKGIGFKAPTYGSSPEFDGDKDIKNYMTLEWAEEYFDALSKKENERQRSLYSTDPVHKESVPAIVTSLREQYDDQKVSWISWVPDSKEYWQVIIQIYTPGESEPDLFFGLSAEGTVLSESCQKQLAASMINLLEKDEDTAEENRTDSAALPIVENTHEISDSEV